jgi:hypothetical protein
MHRGTGERLTVEIIPVIDGQQLDRARDPLSTDAVFMELRLA